MLPEKLIQSIFFQLAFALKYLHAKKIFHRDIKLENILIQFLNNEIQIVLCDFGCSKCVSKTGVIKGVTQVGTHNYMSPEMMDRTVTTHYSVDIWSLGVLICYLCNNKVNLFSSLLKMGYLLIP